MASEVHPGSWLGDGVEEFKKAPTGVKIAIGAAFLLAAGIGYYEYSKSQSSSSGVSGTASPSTDTTSGNGTQQYATVPGGNTGTVPIIPPGYTPLFDSLGNLIGFQQPGATTTTTTTGTGTGTGTTTGTGTGSTGKKKKKKTTSSSGGSTKTTGHTSGHAGNHTSTGNTVKQHQANAKSGGSQSTVHGSQGHTKAPSRSIQPHNTGGSHGYVYTTKPGDTANALQSKFWPGSNYSGGKGNPNLYTYGNNSKILKGATLKNGQIKPGTKILA